MEEEDQKLFDQIPEPKVDHIKKVKVETVCIPHPYCITPKHLEYNDSMYLDADSIKRTEEKGAVCDICKKINKDNPSRPILSYDEHETQKTLFISVPQNKDLNAVEGLHKYLLSIKELCEKIGIGGFAFPIGKQI